jgi:hypothetical protein
MHEIARELICGESSGGRYEDAHWQMAPALPRANVSE